MTARPSTPPRSSADSTAHAVGSAAPKRTRAWGSRGAQGRSGRAGHGADTTRCSGKNAHTPAMRAGGGASGGTSHPASLLGGGSWQHLLRSYAPAVLTVVVGATLYILYSVGQWRSLSVPSWDLAIFTQLAKAYSQFQSPIVPVKGVDYNLLGDHFHPILVLLGPIYRFFPSGLTLLIVQDLLIAVSAWPLVRLATRRAGFWQALALGVAYVTAWGFQGAVASQFHEIAFAVPMLAWASAAFVEGRWRACELWALPLIFVKEDLGLTVFMVGMAIAWRRRHEGARAYGEALGLAAIGVLGFLVATQLVLPAMNPSGMWAYSLAGSEKARASLSIIERLLTPGIKYATLLILVLTAGLMGLMSPWMVCVLPTMGWRYLGSVAFYWDWAHWHYNAVLIPIAVGALLDVYCRFRERQEAQVGEEALAVEPDSAEARGGASAQASSAEETSDPDVSRFAGVRAALGQRGAGRRSLAYEAALVVPLLLGIYLAPNLSLWQMTSPTFGQESPRAATIAQIEEIIPDGATVETDLTLLAYLVPQYEVYWVGSAKGASVDYVVVDSSSSAWGGRDVSAVDYAQSAHPGSRYESILKADKFEVARRIQ